jgi:F-type H+-transporting ATPase subunit gamma
MLDIRRRIRSVKNTQQITKAMKMIAASRLRRAQDRVIAARPYARTLEQTLASVASRVPPNPDGSPLHPLLETRPEKKITLIAVTGDRGLCGGFNANANRAVLNFLGEARDRGVESVDVVALGRKGIDFLKRRSVTFRDQRPGIFSSFDFQTATGIASSLQTAFIAGDTDAVYAVYNEFKSAIAQVVVTKRILPVELPSAQEDGVDYLYEPSAAAILERLVPRHLNFQVFRLLLESNAAENAARMTAMDAATKNAADMIDSLTMTYNRARQARITKELIEVVSGAAALS